MCTPAQLKFIFILFLRDECFALLYICAPHEGQVTTEVRRRLTGTEGHRWLWTTTWMLRIKPRFSTKEADAINHWAISIGPGKIFQLYKNVSCQCVGSFCVWFALQILQLALLGRHSSGKDLWKAHILGQIGSILSPLFCYFNSMWNFYLLLNLSWCSIFSTSRKMSEDFFNCTVFSQVHWRSEASVNILHQIIF